jgi:hypothetical protein
MTGGTFTGPIQPRKPFARWGALAWLAGLAWPPIPITLLLFPPRSWIPGPEGDWRLFALIVAAAGLGFVLWRIERERKAGRGPRTRLGLIWRMVFHGAIFALGVQLIGLLSVLIMGWLGVSGLPQGLGVAETSFLVFGVGLLPLTGVIAAAWAVWAGLIAAVVAYETAPPSARTAPHILRGAEP